jgi:integrase
MAHPGHAIDAFILHGASERGWSLATQNTYRRLITQFTDLAPAKSTDEYDFTDYQRWLNRWVGKSPSTLASGISLARAWSTFLHDQGWSSEDVCAKMRRPRRLRPEDLDVVTISPEDAVKMLAACRDWQELLCIGAALYLGWRRAALNRARRADVDLVRGTMRVREKGGKTLTKPIPTEYLEILRQAEVAGVWDGPESYLVPNRRPASVRRPTERSDKVIWMTVKRVADRAGVRAHVHALRAAFAVQFLTQKPGQDIALKELMGHSRLETTLIYLRRMDKAQAMEEVRDLSFLPGGSVRFESQSSDSLGLQGKAHTGFEPVFAANAAATPFTDGAKGLGL